MDKSRVVYKYIELLKKSLLNDLYIENEMRVFHVIMQVAMGLPVDCVDFFYISRVRELELKKLKACKLEGNTLTITKYNASGQLVHMNDLRNLTELSHTMIGRKRLDNIQFCVESILEDAIEGDFIETGIWRGGACIFMQGLLEAYGATNRILWAADSFEGVPAPSWKEDEGFDLSARILPVLAVSLEEVKELFSRYDLLGDNVRFLKGWFKDTLATAPIEKLALLRLDGDLYESTMDALVPLYDKVVSGGYIIVDDYGSCPPCKRAIEDFRRQRNIVEPLEVIDVQSVFWRKS